MSVRVDELDWARVAQRVFLAVSLGISIGCGSSRQEPPLETGLRLAKSTDAHDRGTALMMLAQEPGERATAALIQIMKADERDVNRAQAADLLASRGDAAVTALINAGVVEPNPFVLTHVGAALQRAGSPAAAKALRLEGLRRNLPLVAGAYQFYLWDDLDPKWQDLLVDTVRCCATREMEEAFKKSGRDRLEEAVQQIEDARTARARELRDAMRKKNSSVIQNTVPLCRTEACPASSAPSAGLSTQAPRRSGSGVPSITSTCPRPSGKSVSS